MKDSIFTKIIKGDIPSYDVYEDAHVLAFLDIHPVQPGHVLVVPKVQVQFVCDLDSEYYQALMAAAQKIAKRLQEVLNAPYVGEQVIGVDVPHAHLHLIPFAKIEEFHHQSDSEIEPDHPALAAMAARLRMQDEL